MEVILGISTSGWLSSRPRRCILKSLLLLITGTNPPLGRCLKRLQPQSFFGMLEIGKAKVDRQQKQGDNHYSYDIVWNCQNRILLKLQNFQCDISFGRLSALCKCIDMNM